MRCSHCSSGRVKRAENFGADRMQCGSCGIVTKQAHYPNTKTGKQQEFIDYVGRWNSERLESSREGPHALTQIGIAEALGMHRSNINRLVQPLIDQGLVRQKRCHITNEAGRVISGRHPKSIYYLTPEGRQHITVKTGGLPLPGYRAETFEASKSDLRRRRRTPFYKIERPEIEEDRDVNRYSRSNAGGALWEATYQALRDDGMSHEQAETFCNSKFFDHYYEYLIEGLRTPMRNLINRLQKPSLGLTRKQRKSNRDARQRVGRYFPDMASENFHAHEGGHFEDIHYESDTYPLRPTRPSGPWPTPTPRPRRPNRRPNPRPRPARRPF